MKRNLIDAKMLASVHHRGQVDKSGVDYIKHPLAVMEMLPYEPPELRIVAVLHDIVEDTDMTLAGLRERGYSDVVVDAVDAISRRESEPYSGYIDRLEKNPLAVQVKIADLKHNLSPARSKTVDESLLRRYMYALGRLTE